MHLSKLQYQPVVEYNVPVWLHLYNQIEGLLNGPTWSAAISRAVVKIGAETLST